MALPAGLGSHSGNLTAQRKEEVFRADEMALIQSVSAHGLAANGFYFIVAQCGCGT
jgi:hypothetical protein